MNKKIVVIITGVAFLTLPFTSKINAHLEAAVHDENKFHRTVHQTVQSAINFYELGPSDTKKIKQAFATPEGIVRVTEKAAYMRVKPGTQHKAVGKAAPIGTRYVYYDIKRVEKTKWFKVLKPNTLNQYYWVSGYCLKVIANKNEMIPNENEQMLDEAVERYFVHKQKAYEEMRWSQFKSGLKHKTPLYEVERRKFKSYRNRNIQPKLVSYQQLDRFMLSENKYWIRTVERYALKNKNNTIKQVYYGSEYLIEKKRDKLYVTKRTSNIAKKFNE